ncbi:uncharacterized protein F4822DRAFT_434871 [Hypoxylon trugodes]|uniref:uncharacterized protein n=1 Tax=Hypoxylon trugodes TaxID=326681 RepID=UPI002192E22A|nr:uncharacterized protein F4822DRAFT_434871 [Hypoxylon trugodes]KAI1382942.1 hypothetical protein F4822DRAFT_434871 [Hypoxylon trugodes]
MSERTPENMKNLAWVAVFLRKIEYFEGILFLTTNQIHMIDPAFISRVNLGVKFPKLDEETRFRIWEKILSDPEVSEAASQLLEQRSTLRKWAGKPLNGRQSRNVVYSARLLTEPHGSKITRENIEDGIQDATGFMDMIEEEMKETEMNYMSHWT